MRNKKKRYIYSFLLLIFLVFCISTNSFAISSNQVTKFDNRHIEYIQNLPEYQQYECYLVKYFVCSGYHNIDICFFNKDDELKFYLSWDSVNKDVLCSNKSFEFYQYSVNIDTHEVVVKGKNSQQLYSIISPYNNGYPIYSSVNIYQDSSCNSFFLNVPLVQMVRVELITPMTVKALKTIILIGLAILSIGLLIYVIKSVILHMT